MFVMNVFFRIKKAFYHFTAENSLLKDFLAVFNLDLHILNDLVSLLDPDQRSQLAEALTSGFLHAHMLMLSFVMGSKIKHNTRSILGQREEFLINLCRSCCNTARTGTDKDPAVICCHLFSG